MPKLFSAIKKNVWDFVAIAVVLLSFLLVPAFDAGAPFVANSAVPYSESVFALIVAGLIALGAGMSTAQREGLNQVMGGLLVAVLLCCVGALAIWTAVGTGGAVDLDLDWYLSASFLLVSCFFQAALLKRAKKLKEHDQAKLLIRRCAAWTCLAVDAISLLAIIFVIGVKLFVFTSVGADFQRNLDNRVKLPSSAIPYEVASRDHVDRKAQVVYSWEARREVVALIRENFWTGFSAGVASVSLITALLGSLAVKVARDYLLAEISDRPSPPASQVQVEV